MAKAMRAVARPRAVDRWHWRERRYTQAVVKRLVQRFEAEELGKPGDLHAAFLDAMKSEMREGIASIPTAAHRLARAATRDALPVLVELTSEALHKRAPDLLAAERGTRIGFEEDLRARWGDAFDLLTMCREVALEAGIGFHQRRKPAAGDFLYAALVRLHARACLLSSEILALLRSGHASGAHARWRSLHEVAVVASFLKDHGQEVARRYMRHAPITSRRAAVDYNRYARRLNYEPFSNEEMEQMDKARDELLAEFGQDFGAENGWAANVLGPRPTFRQIEEATDLEHWRPYYRMASHPTHAGPHALEWDLGAKEGSPLMLAGPSNSGLTDPGQSMAISLLQVTASLLTHESDLGDVVALQVLLELTRAAEDALMTAHERLEVDSAELGGTAVVATSPLNVIEFDA